jgi:hypothetical protein
MLPVLPAGDTLPSLSVAGAALNHGERRGVGLSCDGAMAAMAVVLGFDAPSACRATDERAARDGATTAAVGSGGTVLMACAKFW